MAYGLKYYNTSYNRFGTPVRVELYQEGGSGSSQITLKSVNIKSNFQDFYTPMIGTGAKIVIVNTGAFSDFNTLLSNYEKQWKCIIYYNSVVVFTGFLICDINEQQLIANAEITLQFTNYIRRLEDVYLTTALADISKRKTVWALVSEALSNTGIVQEVYINSTLYESLMVESATTTFLEQAYLECDLFYISPEESMDAYSVVNRVLAPFNIHLYMYGDKWVLERFNDVSRAGNWVKVSTGGVFSNAGVSLKQEISYQSSHFKYVDASQVLQYNSGAKLLKINLNEYQFDSMIFNNYSAILSDLINYFTPLGGGTWDDTNQPIPSDLPLSRNWYQHPGTVDVVKGADYRGVSQYFTAQTSTGYGDARAYHGIYYKFGFSRCLTSLDGIRQKTNINFKWKVLLPDNYTNYDHFHLRFSLGFKGVFFMHGANRNVDGALYFGNFFMGPTTLYYNKWAVKRYPLGTPAPIITSLTIKTADIKDGVYDVDFSLPLEELYIEWAISGEDQFEQVVDEDLLSELLEISISFFPMFADDLGIAGSPTLNSIGDIQVTVSPEIIENEISNTLNENFVKTETVDLDIFDLPNINYVNSPLIDIGSAGDINEGFVTSVGWRDGGTGTYTKMLVDLFVEGKMSKWAQTTKKLVATISCDMFLKLFSLFSDSNIGATKYSLTQYNWDLINGTYEIEAEEYPDTDIIISKS